MERLTAHESLLRAYKISTLAVEALVGWALDKATHRVYTDELHAANMAHLEIVSKGE